MPGINFIGESKMDTNCCVNCNMLKNKVIVLWGVYGYWLFGMTNIMVVWGQ